MLWDMGIKNFADFFAKFTEMDTCSLTLTKKSSNILNDNIWVKLNHCHWLDHCSIPYHIDGNKDENQRIYERGILQSEDSKLQAELSLDRKTGELASLQPHVISLTKQVIKGFRKLP